MIEECSNINDDDQVMVVGLLDDDQVIVVGLLDDDQVIVVGLLESRLLYFAIIGFT